MLAARGFDAAVAGMRVRFVAVVYLRGPRPRSAAVVRGNSTNTREDRAPLWARGLLFRGRPLCSASRGRQDAAHQARDVAGVGGELDAGQVVLLPHDLGVNLAKLLDAQGDPGIRR